MKHSYLILLFIVILSIEAGFAQSQTELLYTSPLYQSADPTGKFVSRVIDVELTKLAIKKKSGELKKIAFKSDTTLLRFYQQDSLPRSGQGFLDPASIKLKLQQLNIPVTKILLIYDVTAHHDFSSWKPPKVLVGGSGMFAGSIVVDNLSMANLNNFDSLWCKLSFIDFINPENSKNEEIIANESTCSGDPIECVVETIRNTGRTTTISSNKPSLQFIGTPKSQHWGKIIGGSLLIAGGIGIFTLSNIMVPESHTITNLGCSAMVCGGATLLTIGIIKQSRYYK